MSDVILHLRALRIAFGGVVACDIDDIAVRRNEILAVIGPNGAGKTSLLNAISGVYPPASGASLKFTNRAGMTTELVGLPSHRRVRHGVVRTFQHLGLFPELSVVDNLMLGRYVHQRSGPIRGGLATRRAVGEQAVARAFVERTMARLGVSSFRDAVAGDLPYGVQKRIEFGRALMIEPELLLLDEPVAGMNAEEKAAIQPLILDERRDRGTTIVLIEHDVNFVMGIADRVLVMNFGVPIALGTPDQVRSNPEVIDAYFGSTV